MNKIAYSIIGVIGIIISLSFIEDGYTLMSSVCVGTAACIPSLCAYTYWKKYAEEK